MQHFSVYRHLSHFSYLIWQKQKLENEIFTYLAVLDLPMSSVREWIDFEAQNMPYWYRLKLILRLSLIFSETIL